MSVETNRVTHIRRAPKVRRIIEWLNLPSAQEKRMWPVFLPICRPAGADARNGMVAGCNMSEPAIIHVLRPKESRQ